MTNIASGTTESIDKLRKIVQTDPEVRQKAREELEAYFASKRNDSDHKKE